MKKNKKTKTNFEKIKNKLFIVIVVIIIMLVNDLIYAIQITTNLWTTQELIFFLNIINIALISFFVISYISTQEQIMNELYEIERRRIIDYASNYIKKTYKEKQKMLTTIKKLEKQVQEKRKKNARKNGNKKQ